MKRFAFAGEPRLAPPPETQLVRRLLPLVLLGATVSGSLAGLLATSQTPALAALLPLVLVPVLVWRSPSGALLALLAGAVTIEQFAYTVGSGSGAATSRLPFFRTVTAGSGVTPMELLLALVIVVWAMKTVQRGEALIHRSPIGTALAAYCVLLIAFTALGVARHGTLRPAMWEIKPFLYVAVFYVLASSLLADRRSVRRALWVFVIGSGLKAVYGLLIFLTVRHMVPRPDAVLGHEESFFFGLFVIATLGMWTFGVGGRLRATATTLLPLVLMADMVNSRRTAWAILFAGVLLMTIISYVRFPARRGPLLRCMSACAVGLVVYLPLYWSRTGATAQPARAVRSVVAPSSSDARDSSSDRYRMAEDANLIVNIRAHRGTGSGFGVPIDYEIAITDLTGVASMLAYVPHDGVYWIWMRMGILGEGVFLLVIAHGVIAGCRLSRTANPEVALFGALVVCALLAYVIMGEKDLGFWWLRLAACIGVLLGTVDAQARTAGVRV